MVRLIQTIALGAALVTLITCIWRDYGILAALPRVAIAYLATFFLGAVLALGGRTLAEAVGRRPADAAAAGGVARRRRGRAPTPVASETTAPAETPAAAAK
jgi:hypothetical protein